MTYEWTERVYAHNSAAASLVAGREETREYLLATEHGQITIEERPEHCNRGRWLAKMHQKGRLNNPWFDDGTGSGGWPRYYFDLDRAKAELEAWVEFREKLHAERQSRSQEAIANARQRW